MLLAQFLDCLHCQNVNKTVWILHLFNSDGHFLDVCNINIVFSGAYILFWVLVLELRESSIAFSQLVVQEKMKSVGDFLCLASVVLVPFSKV